uniref:Uncharacterized protein n=1 Tax=Rhizophora mucronata TaxID=61149 RepID=A0A2P2PV50_RHIMU
MASFLCSLLYDQSLDSSDINDLFCHMDC